MTALRRCGCGRPIVRGGPDEVFCAEHDDTPLLDDEPEEDDDLGDCALCGNPVEDPDDVFCGDCIEAINSTDVFILYGRPVDTLQPNARFL